MILIVVSIPRTSHAQIFKNAFAWNFIFSPHQDASGFGIKMRYAYINISGPVIQIFSKTIKSPQSWDFPSAVNHLPFKFTFGDKRGICAFECDT